MDASTVDVAVWNIEADGGRNGERRDFALDILAGLGDGGPDVLLQQEAKFSRERGNQLMHATEKRLKLRGFLSAPNPDADADIATAVYLRPDMFQVAEARPRAKPWWLHPCHVTAKLGDCPIPLNLISFHMCWFDANNRLTEAGWLTTQAQLGMATLAGGDTNSYPRSPEPISLPDWDKVTDRAHMVHRTFLDTDGHRRSDTRPDGALIDAEYVDLARHAADHLGQVGALAATAGFDKPHQGGPQRIDRTYSAGGIAAALDHVEVIDNEDTRAVSDHGLVFYRFHRTRLERVLTQVESVLCA
ncbi:endonuclease/exonuclease/phosphatase family protein [Streptomyces boncukensis]|uniref:Endonuclease/exonuclease/phosphatase family protein n=1 Tax=Streptomyces boncukensis TaxID=2711219 RepID=A0A6G4WPS9_9ACTN|nr:endonuclease/exonuclease/phosphatase family protein [Streptomyces boncukensis]NGO66832.1 endonuclease/exonuclease/phosphatase family protein [Streptomyces boncukensis]